MESMFENSNFNQPVNNWNVQNVNSMVHIFKNNALFNQNITKKQLFASQHLDRDFYLDMFAHVTDGSPDKGYKQRMKKQGLIQVRI